MYVLEKDFNGFHIFSCHHNLMSSNLTARPWRLWLTACTAWCLWTDFLFQAWTLSIWTGLPLLLDWHAVCYHNYSQRVMNFTAFFIQYRANLFMFATYLSKVHVSVSVQFVCSFSCFKFEMGVGHLKFAYLRCESRSVYLSSFTTQIEQQFPSRRSVLQVAC